MKIDHGREKHIIMKIDHGRVNIIRTIIETLYLQGIIGSGLCFVGMSWCVKKRGPVFTAAFSPFVQIMAALIDIPVLHEQLYLGR
jgi:hypothetical protein